MMPYKRNVVVIIAAIGFLLVGLSGDAFTSVANTARLATPTPTPRPRIVVGSPVITTTPSASPTPKTSPTPGGAAQTIEELQSKIRMRMNASEVRRGRVGIKIVSLASGKVVFENDADKYFMPASNQKNFTVATGFERLGPDFRFVTSVYATTQPDTAGTVKGDVRIFGRGDVSISTAFFGTTPTDPNTYFKGIDRLVDKIAAAGVKKIDGNLLADDSYFKGFYIPDTWEWDDLQAYYGAEVSALPINDNAVDLSVTPGTAGGPCIATILPGNTLFQINNTCVTTNSPPRRTLSVTKRIDRNILDITGTMPTNDAGYRTSIAITRPADLFVALLKRRLESTGIVVTGTARSLAANIPREANPIEIAKLESVPFREIAGKTMKPSQNMFTETILWAIGENARAKNPNPTGGGPSTSAQLGIAEVKSFLASIGIPSDGILPYDGSGLSRHNLITPNAVVSLYAYMAKSPNALAWRDSLTIGGVDGTLRNRFVGTAAANNMRGKTGTIDQVSALSGYVKTAAGEELVLSFIVNGVAITSQRTSLMDEIVVNLANYNGRID
ncbi:MAG: D-alanyl-D-alanine carboxypeptidase/D-alanyl-D-alanine-endopeptidase [Pyrinomonadaceae bacterium]